MFAGVWLFASPAEADLIREVEPQPPVFREWVREPRLDPSPFPPTLPPRFRPEPMSPTPWELAMVATLGATLLTVFVGSVVMAVRRRRAGDGIALDD